jgi:hypothetical protein
MGDYNDPYQDNNQSDSDYQFSHQKSRKVWLFVGIILFIMAIGTIAFIFTNNPEETKDADIGIDRKDIILDVLTSKDTYGIHEEISGEYYLKYQGEPFKGAVICCSDKGCSRAIGMIDDIDFNDPAKTRYLKTELTGFFQDEGTYNYSIYIYDCNDINEAFNRDDCSGGMGIYAKEILEKVIPLKSKSKSIVVIEEEEEYIPECTVNENCTQICTNCDRGTYICASSSDVSIDQTCVECINSFGCVDGYECEDYECVEEEPEEEPEYNVTDPETVMDCFSEDLSEAYCDGDTVLAFTYLFEDRLEPCEISDGTFGLGWEPIFGIFRGYEIQEEQGDNCVVKFWFLENLVIDPSLLGKEMVCEYGPSQRNTQYVSECLEECCTGELVDAMNELTQ